MQKTSLSHTLPYPAFRVEWIKHRMVVITGGGGASKTGIPNGVIIYRVTDGIENLEKHREYNTGDELPHWSKALPTIGIMAVAIGHRVEILRLDDLKKLATVIEIEEVPGQLDPIIIAAFSDDGSTLAVAAHDGLVRVFKLKIRNPGSEVEVQVERNKVCISKEKADRPYRDLAFHPNGYHIIGSSEDGTWRVWALTPSWGLEAEDVMTATTGTSPSPDHLYTCRCGKFSPDGNHLFTIHYLRRGPKHADKRAWLTKWSVEEGPDKRLVVSPLLTKPVNVPAPLMCMDISDDGLLGVAGDSEGRTVTFRTEDLSLQVKENMHSFAVTAVSIAPTLGVAAPTNADGSLNGAAGGSYLIASSSGDRTLRLQYRAPPTPPLSTQLKEALPYIITVIFVMVMMMIMYMMIYHHQSPHELDQMLRHWWFGGEGGEEEMMIPKATSSRWGGRFARRFSRQTH